jgi:hypothetical protein
MRHPDLPTNRQRIEAAEATGILERYTLGRDQGAPDEQALAELVGATRDPSVLGHVLGSYLVRAEASPAYARAVELLRAAGADEGQAALKAQWLRGRGGLLP